MKYKLLVLLTLVLLLPALAVTDQELFQLSQDFDKAVDSAETVDQLFDYITSSSVERIKEKDQASQEKILTYLQMAVAMSPEDLKIIESKIGSEQAALTIGVEEDGMTMSREVEFRKDEGKWKLDLLAFLDKLS